MRFWLLLLWPLGLAAQPSLPDQLDKQLQSAGFNGTVLIARQGTVLLEKGYGWRNYEAGAKNDSATIFPLASITKQFTAALVLQLQEEGRLNVKDPLSRYFPDYPNARQVTLHHLLCHTSGIPDYIKAVVVMNDPAKVSAPASDSAIRGAFWYKPLQFTPGSRWAYSNSGYYLLKLVIEKVTGKNYYTVFRERILQPLHITPAGFDFQHLQHPNRAQGYIMTGKDDGEPVNTFDSTVANAAGALYTTARGLYGWDRAVARGLAGERNGVLQRSSWEQALRPYRSYNGYGWIVDSIYGRPFQRHGGNMPGFSTDILRLPKEDVTIILLDNRDSQDHADLMVKLIATVLNEPFNIPVAAISEASLQQFAGTYDGNWTLRVKPAGNGLQLQAGKDTIRLEPAGGAVFYSRTFFGKFIFRDNGLEVNRLGHVFDFTKTAAP